MCLYYKTDKSGPTIKERKIEIRFNAPLGPTMLGVKRSTTVGYFSNKRAFTSVTFAKVKK